MVQKKTSVTRTERHDSVAQLSSREALDELFVVVYAQLRRLAYRIGGADRASPISPTTLVHEAYVKLLRSKDLPETSELHFRRVAARAMRQVLVDAARRRNSRKRGGDELFVTLDYESSSGTISVEKILIVDECVNQLAEINPRQAQVVEYMFFSGLGVTEVAELLDTSEETVRRDWRAAKAWLAIQLKNLR